MRETLIGIITALATLVNTSTLKWWARLLAAIVAAAIAVAVCLFAPGCQSTTYLDGKTYAWRFDVLTPIGQTTTTAPAWLPPDPNAPKPK